MSEEKEPMGMASFLNSQKWVTDPGSKIVRFNMQVIGNANKGDMLEAWSGESFEATGEEVIYTLKNG